jgi:hypothetical protein
VDLLQLAALASSSGERLVSSAHHRRDANELGQPRNLFAVDAALVTRRRRLQRVDDFGRHGADRVGGAGCGVQIGVGHAAPW